MCLEYPLITRYIQGNEHIVHDISQNKPPISNTYFFKKQMGSGFRRKRCLCFQDFQGFKVAEKFK